MNQSIIWQGRHLLTTKYPAVSQVNCPSLRCLGCRALGVRSFDVWRASAVRPGCWQHLHTIRTRGPMQPLYACPACGPCAQQKSTSNNCKKTVGVQNSATYCRWTNWACTCEILVHAQWCTLHLACACMPTRTAACLIEVMWPGAPVLMETISMPQGLACCTWIQGQKDMSLGCTSHTTHSDSVHCCLLLVSPRFHVNSCTHLVKALLAGPTQCTSTCSSIAPQCLYDCWICRSESGVEPLRPHCLNTPGFAISTIPVALCKTGRPCACAARPRPPHVAVA